MIQKSVKNDLITYQVFLCSNGFYNLNYPPIILNNTLPIDSKNGETIQEPS